MKNFSLLFAIATISTLFFSGTPMALAQEQTSATSPTTSENSQAEVVFLRHSFYGSNIKATLYEVTDHKTIFIGIIENKESFSYRVSPGKHTFMIVSEAADFLEADVLPGRTYYSIVTPRMGAWKARFSLWPIRNDGTTEFHTQSPDFKKWTAEATPVTINDKDKEWYEKHKESVESKRADYMPAWKKKSAADIAERTLKPSDGVIQPSH
jgi:hypothetical protein